MSILGVESLLLDLLDGRVQRFEEFVDRDAIDLRSPLHGDRLRDDPAKRQPSETLASSVITSRFMKCLQFDVVPPASTTGSPPRRAWATVSTDSSQRPPCLSAYSPELLIDPVSLFKSRSYRTQTTSRSPSFQLSSVGNIHQMFRRDVSYGEPT